MAGASLGGMAAMHAQGGLPIPDIVHIEQPYWFENGIDLTPAEFGLRAARAAAREDRGTRPGTGRGLHRRADPGRRRRHHPARDLLAGDPARSADEYGILLIADEVICGFGRTGHWFGCEHYGIRAGLHDHRQRHHVRLLPLGGVMVGDRVADVLIEKGGEFNHGFT